MKILIIGSKGFIGSHLMRFFADRHDIWGCDIIEDSSYNYIKLPEVADAFLKIFRMKQWDVCINCSGSASVPMSLQRPLNDFELNTANVGRMLDAIRETGGYCRFINMSSAAVYGNPAHLPIRETDPVQPVSPYGCHKLMAEQLCSEYYRFWGVRSCSVRLFSAYGPGLRKQLLWDVAMKASKNDSIELFGTGNETRDFIYVTDIARMIGIVIDNDYFGDKIINCANGVQISVREIVSTIMTELDCRKPVVFQGQNRAGDPLNWEADISEARRLGYSPSVEITSGIHNYISWLKEERLL